MSELNHETLQQEQAWWEQKEAQAQRAVDYASAQLERIAQKIVELQASGTRHLMIVRDCLEREDNGV